MDIFGLSRWLVRFELPFFHVQADFGSPAPNFRGPIPGVLPQNNIRNFGAGFVGYARQRTRRFCFFRPGARFGNRSKSKGRWKFGAKKLQFQEGEDKHYSRNSGAKLVGNDEWMNQSSCDTLAGTSRKSTIGVDLMPVYLPISKVAVHQTICTSAERGAVEAAPFSYPQQSI